MKHQTIHVRLTDEQYTAFKRLCVAEGTTISDMVRQRVNEMLIPCTPSDWE